MPLSSPRDVVLHVADVVDTTAQQLPDYKYKYIPSINSLVVGFRYC